MVDDTKDGVNDVNTLRILAPSGDHFMMNTAGLTTIGDLKATVYNTWPKELVNEEKPELCDGLKFLYQGRFLSDEDEIKNLKFVFSDVLTFHMLILGPAPTRELDKKKTDCCNCSIV